MIRHCQFQACDIVTQTLAQGKWSPASGPFCSKHNTPEKRRGAALLAAAEAASHNGSGRRAQ
jgi:hypothetical protein